MIVSNTELAEMISTRISHDLIGNIGALSSALELLRESNNELDEGTLGILNTASSTLKARQTFFRIAFGLDTKSIDTQELNKICQDYLVTVGSRVSPLTLELNSPSSDLAKFFCLCVMIGAEVCVRGGNIAISVSKNNMTIDVKSDYPLSSPKIGVYKDILQNVLPQDNVSQYVQLIYLRELLGSEVPMNLSSEENHMQLVIG